METTHSLQLIFSSWILLIYYSTLLTTFLLFFFFILNDKKTLSLASVVKNTRIANLFNFLRNANRVLEWSTELLSESETATVDISPITILTSNPANVEYILKSNFDNYNRSDVLRNALHDFLGQGILNADGEGWKTQRRTASFEFNTKSIRSFALDKVRHEADTRLIPMLREASHTGEVIDLQDVLERFAFDNVCSLVFGRDPNCLLGRSNKDSDSEKFFRAFGDATHLSCKRAILPFSFIWRSKKFLNVGSEKRLKEAMGTIHEVIEGYIWSRRRELKDKNNKRDRSDFLSRFMEDGIHSDDFIRDTLINFVLAGRDTTPSAMTWFFWQVARRSKVVEKIREELRSIRGGSTASSAARSYTYKLEELREMDYLHAALSESIRLWPPVPLVLRECQKDDVLPTGMKVKKGTTVMYCSFVMGRSRKIWGEDCMEFKPERWLDKDRGVFKPRSMYEYPMFHAGPRMCLGKDMAYIQMKGVASSIFEGFDLEVAEERGKHELSVGTRMLGGLPVHVKERQT